MDHLIAILVMVSGMASNVSRAEEPALLADDPGQTVEFVRTSSTAKKLKINVQVSVVNTECQRWDTRMVWGQDPRCGYSNVVEWHCNGNFCNPNFYPHGCGFPGYRPGYGGCGYYNVTRMNFCEFPQQYCGQYGDVARVENRDIRLNFKKAATLRGNEQEVYKITTRQTVRNDSDLTVEVVPVRTKVPYKIQVKDGLGRGYIDTIIVRR